ncbi:hypothetical protein WDZ92_00005, partial [Nostoc sp. NIES-2111]
MASMKASIFLGFSLPYQLYLGWIFVALGMELRLAAAEPISLPIEVMGPNGSTKEIRLEVPEGTSCQPCYLLLRFHGLSYNGQASLQWGDDAPWIPLDETNPAFQVKGLAKVYGGLGGGFASIPATLALGNIGPGSYVLRFRFNRTDGVSSGYRLLEVNFLSNGKRLIDEEAFVQDNPDLWEAPFPDEDSIRRGRELWYSANLTVPNRGAIKAHCSDCHAHDGRDLKYFNYSNYAIRSRSIFHGLSSPEGDQIASYIRSLPIEAPGRPWNPPYQPGPGLDSRPVTQWAAGAGLSAVLEQDAETLRAIFPNGINSTATAPSGELSAREIPVA